MNITKCDICKKTIKKGSESVHISVGNVFSNHTEICSDCGEPVLKLLRDKKLITDEDKKYGRKK